MPCADRQPLVDGRTATIGRAMFYSARRPSFSSLLPPASSPPSPSNSDPPDSLNNHRDRCPLTRMDSPNSSDWWDVLDMAPASAPAPAPFLVGGNGGANAVAHDDDDGLSAMVDVTATSTTINSAGEPSSSDPCKLLPPPAGCVEGALRDGIEDRRASLAPALEPGRAAAPRDNGIGDSGAGVEGAAWEEGRMASLREVRAVR